MKRRPRSGRLGGDLGEFGLPELVQTLHQGRKTAWLVVRTGGRHGEIWFREGAITHATTSTRFGDLAVFEMLEWSEGQFAVEYGVETNARSITQDPTFLLLEGLRRIDERQPLEAPPVGVGMAPPPAAARTGRVISAAVVATVAVAALAAINLVSGPELTEAVETPIQRAPIAVAKMKPPAKKPASKRSTKPESPLSYQPVPSSPVVPEPALMLDSMEPATVPTASTLIVLGTSSGAGGAIVLLVDGKPVFTHDDLTAGKTFETKVGITPGEHLLVARLQGTKEEGEDSVRASFTSGESQTLRITANRRFGAPVKVRLYYSESSSSAATTPAESALR
jgi:uncharacterized protein DUF4388